MEISTFKDFYLAELQELADGRRQLAEAEQRMVEKATHPSLKDILDRHCEETEAQKDRLESILQKHGASATEHTDQSMQALIRESDKMVGMMKGEDLCDAGLIASVQKIEHYEIAAFGTACALAAQLSFEDDEQMLRESLEEAKSADAELTKLAEEEVNQDAAVA